MHLLSNVQLGGGYIKKDICTDIKRVTCIHKTQFHVHITILNFKQLCGVRPSVNYLWINSGLLSLTQIVTTSLKYNLNFVSYL